MIKKKKLHTKERTMKKTAIQTEDVIRPRWSDCLHVFLFFLGIFFFSKQIEDNILASINIMLPREQDLAKFKYPN